MLLIRSGMFFATLVHRAWDNTALSSGGSGEDRRGEELWSGRARE